MSSTTRRAWGSPNDLAAIAAEVRRAGRRSCSSNGISAVAGIPIQIREWGIDAIVGGTQKGLAAPAGLALVHLSDRAVAALHPGTFYLDLKAHLAPLEKNDTPWTPAVPLFLALREALLLLKEEGLDRRLEHTRPPRRGDPGRAWTASGSSCSRSRAFASDTVTAIRNPTGPGDPQLRKVLEKEYNVLLQGGQGALTGKIFRIGHMGIADWPDLLVTFAALERILARTGRLRTPGAAVRAVVDHMPYAGARVRLDVDDHPGATAPDVEDEVVEGHGLHLGPDGVPIRVERFPPRLATKAVAGDPDRPDLDAGGEEPVLRWIGGAPSGTRPRGSRRRRPKR